MGGRLVIDAQVDSLTVDEPVYIQSGICALTQGHLNLDSTNPPIFKLLGGAGALLLAHPALGNCATSLPASADAWAASSVFSISPTELRQLTVGSRLPIIGIALLLAVVVFLWARAIYGYVAGLLALAIVAFEPTILGHAHLVTGDLSLTLGFTVCLAADWRWHQTGRKRWLLIAGGGLGWALLSKASGLELLPLLAVIELAFGHGSLLARARDAVAPLLMVAVTAWVLVCLVYLPFGTTGGQPQWWAPPFSWVVPPQWFAGLSFQLHHLQAGHVAYLNGQVVPAHSSWYYFLEAIALKTTLGLLLLAVTAAIRSVVLRDRVSLYFLWLPIALIISAATLGGIDIGVRYVLPAYPLMAVAAGLVVSHLGSTLFLGRAAAGVAFGALAIASIGHAPNDIGYFNELARADPARYLSDSNLDWGQDAWRLKSWWEANDRPSLAADYFGRLPLGLYGVSSLPIPPDRGSQVQFLVVSVENMTTPRDPRLADAYRKLLTIQPAVQIGTSIRVYKEAGS